MQIENYEGILNRDPEADRKTQYRVIRDGDRDLRFTGWLIGSGAHGTGGNGEFASDWMRGVDVSIYLTSGGNLVTAVKRWSRWQGENDQHAAALHKTGGEVLDWLRADTHDGRLGPASKAAWEQACERVPELEGADVEEVQ